MGVKGLTSYIHSRVDLFFDDVQLKDCAIIVDGNSLAATLYNSNLAHTSAFGGDYDRIGDEVEKFFKKLLSNNVFPIVVFDGAVERRKFSTCKTRCARKVLSLQGVTPFNYNCNCFPLFMRAAMRGKLIDMGIIVLQTDLEADSEIAALSKIYKAPVLSNDSDYFIFDVLYVPIPMLEIVKGEVRCKMFRIEKFLAYLDLDRSRLPLLAVVLGNDYIQRGQFAPFLGQIKLGKGSRSSNGQKQIAGVLRWIKKESVASALQKILSCMRTRGREFLRRKIIKIIKGYTNLTTVLENYVPNDPRIKPFNGFKPLKNVEIAHIESDDSEVEETSEITEKEKETSPSEQNSYCSSEPEGAESDDVDLDVDSILSGNESDANAIANPLYPEWLMRKSRKGLVPPSILTLLNLKTFFSTPQPENYELPYAGQPYTELLRYIGGLLMGETEIQYWHRQHRNKYEKITVETISSSNSCDPFPPLENLPALSCDDRKSIFNDIMFVDEGNLKNVPDHMKLYVIAVNYWLQKDGNFEIKPYHLHAVIMMMICMLVIDEHIGYHRQRKSFIKKYGSALGKIAKSRGKSSRARATVADLSQALDQVTKDDCVLIFDSLLPYFHVDRQIRNSKHFSSSLIHSFARLQCCIEFAAMLNAALSSPYADMKEYKFYNGTFLYNISGNLKKRANIQAYAETFFTKAPSLHNVYKKLDETFQTFAPRSKRILRKRSKKKNSSTVAVEKIVENVNADPESDNFYDGNNKFCALMNC